MANITTEQIIEHVTKMTALELKELVSLIETKFGVTAQAQAVVAPTATVEAKPTTVSLYLTELGPNKIGIYKLIKEVKKELSLIDSKKLADQVTTAKQVILENVDLDTAEALATKFKEIGAVTETK